VFKRARHWFLSWTRCIQSTQYHPTFLRSNSNITLPSTPRSSRWSLPVLLNIHWAVRCLYFTLRWVVAGLITSGFAVSVTTIREWWWRYKVYVLRSLLWICMCSSAPGYGKDTGFWLLQTSGKLDVIFMSFIVKISRPENHKIFFRVTRYTTLPKEVSNTNGGLYFVSPQHKNINFHFNFVQVPLEQNRLNSIFPTTFCAHCQYKLASRLTE
jgi:hypothetical protein